MGGQAGGQPLGDDELTKMLQALRDMAETGARDQARQLLSDMQRMLDKMENMQIQMSRGGQGGQQPDGPMNRAMNRALQDTNRAMGDQRDLDERDRGSRPRRRPRRNASRNSPTSSASFANVSNSSSAPAAASRSNRVSKGSRVSNPVRVNSRVRATSPASNKARANQDKASSRVRASNPDRGKANSRARATSPANSRVSNQANNPVRDRASRPIAAAPGGGQPGRPNAQGDGRYAQENDRTRRMLGNAIEMQKRAEEALAAATSAPCSRSAAAGDVIPAGPLAGTRPPQ